MRRVSADKKFEQIVFAAYRQEGWADETLMAMIQDRQYAALRRLVKKQQRWEQMMNIAGLTTHHHGRWIDWNDLLAAMDRWKKGTK